MIAALAAIVADTEQALTDDGPEDQQMLLVSVLEQLSGLVEYCTGADVEAVAE